MHFDVERLFPAGVFRVEQMVVFQRIPGTYDVIMSFNQLQQNYFPRDVIARGVDHLDAALTEAGLLVMGYTESFTALEKRDGALVP